MLADVPLAELVDFAQEGGAEEEVLLRGFRHGEFLGRSNPKCVEVECGWR